MTTLTTFVTKGNAACHCLRETRTQNPDDNDDIDDKFANCDTKENRSSDFSSGGSSNKPLSLPAANVIDGENGDFLPIRFSRFRRFSLHLMAKMANLIKLRKIDQFSFSLFSPTLSNL